MGSRKCIAWVRNQRVPQMLKVLDLTPDFDLVKLKAAYRREAMIHHPDRKGGDKRKFEGVHTAYVELLKTIN